MKAIEYVYGVMFYLAFTTLIICAFGGLDKTFAIAAVAYLAGDFLSYEYSKTKKGDEK